MQAFAWDLETNTLSTQNFTVAHKRDKKGGNGAPLTEERDIYEMTANMGARRLRSRILAVLPPELIDDAINECKRTLAHGGTESLADKIRKMTSALSSLGITPQMISGRLGHPVDQMTPEEVVEMRGVFQSVKDGMSKVSDWFGTQHNKRPSISKDADSFEKAAAGQSEAADA